MRELACCAVLLDANGTAGTDVITFAVAGRIKLTSAALPALTDAVTIDGTTGTGRFAGVPVVEVDANGFAGVRLDAGAAGSTLKSLALVNADADGVTLRAGQITLTGNYIGLRPDGRTAAGNAGQRDND